MHWQEAVASSPVHLAIRTDKTGRKVYHWDGKDGEIQITVNAPFLRAATYDELEGYYDWVPADKVGILVKNEPMKCHKCGVVFNIDQIGFLRHLDNCSSPSSPRKRKW